MQRSPFSSAPFLLFPSSPLLLFTLSVLLLLAACTASSTEVSPSVTGTLAPTLTQTPAPSASPTLAPSATFTPTTRPTRRPTSTIAPTRTVVPPTATLEPMNWLVETIEIFDWPLPEEIWSAVWQNDTQIIVDVKHPAIDVVFELMNSQINQIVAPTPTPHNFDLNYSPTRNYWLDCSDETIRLYRVPNELVSESENGSYVCYLADWKEDESAVAFVSTKDALIYIWPTNGQAPYTVGTGGMEASVEWSPDQTKLLVVGLPFPIPTFNIVHYRTENMF